MTETYPINLIEKSRNFNLFVAPVESWTYRLSRWLDRAQRIVNADYAANYPTLTPPSLEMSMGRRYVRVDALRESGSTRRVFAFIDTRTGDILMPATYRAPAKHARGNLFNGDFGTDCVTPHGIRYLSAA